MKQPKKLTYLQKKFLSSRGIDTSKYRLKGESDADLELIDMQTGELIKVQKRH